jgi:23S rRNA pseudouridine1911/1915/1917 synthase
LQHIQVIYEDNHLIAVNKRAGDIVHADETQDATLEDAVKEYIKVRYNKPGDVWLGVLHRLDRPATGVTIFARTSKAAERMSKLFQKREINKTYYAITKKTPDPLEGKLIHYIVKDEATNRVKVKNTPGTDGKKAELFYEVVGHLDAATLIKINLLTGRPHQARAQLAKIGCPILGDLKYGDTIAHYDQSIALHCREMSFIHPVTNKPIKITADFPKIHYWRDLKNLVV